MIEYSPICARMQLRRIPMTITLSTLTLASLLSLDPPSILAASPSTLLPLPLKVRKFPDLLYHLPVQCHNHTLSVHSRPSVSIISEQCQPRPTRKGDLDPEISARTALPYLEEQLAPPTPDDPIVPRHSRKRSISDGYQRGHALHSTSPAACHKYGRM